MVWLDIVHIHTYIILMLFVMALYGRWALNSHCTGDDNPHFLGHLLLCDV